LSAIYRQMSAELTIDENVVDTTENLGEPSKPTYNQLLMCSSLVFITNVVSTFSQKMYTYSLLFFGLTMTSVAVHYHTTIYTSIIDKVFVYAIVFYGGHVLYVKTTPDTQPKVLGIVITFLLCIILFFYGYLANEYCYHPEKQVSNRYHGLLHVVASLGHHCIVFL